jgi:hypothetical protein
MGSIDRLASAIGYPQGISVDSVGLAFYTLVKRYFQQQRKEDNAG